MSCLFLEKVLPEPEVGISRGTAPALFNPLTLRNAESGCYRQWSNMNKSPLLPEDIKLFYALMLLSESKMIHNNFVFTKTTDWCKDNGVTIKTSTKVSKPSENTICYLDWNPNAKLSPVKMISHFRNAFCHLCISYDGDNIVMEDFTYKDANDQSIKKTRSLSVKIKKTLFLNLLKLMDKKALIENIINTINPL